MTQVTSSIYETSSIELLQTIQLEKNFLLATSTSPHTLEHSFIFSHEDEWQIINGPDIDSDTAENKLDVTCENPDPRYEGLVEEIKSLRAMVMDLKQISLQHGDKVKDITESLFKYEEKIKEVWIEVQTISGKTNPCFYHYIIRSIAYTLLSFVGMHLPLFLLLGLKSGMLTLPFSYLVYKLKYLF